MPNQEYLMFSSPLHQAGTLTHAAAVTGLACSACQRQPRDAGEVAPVEREARELVAKRFLAPDQALNPRNFHTAYTTHVQVDHHAAADRREQAT